MSAPQGKFDTLYEGDERYHAAETDGFLTAPPEMFGSRRIGVALIGVGRMGAIHLFNILREPRANLLYALDIDNSRLDFMKKKYFLDERGVTMLNTNDVLVALQDKKVEVVVIATSTRAHEQYVRLALEHNKHVICEKPLAQELEAVDSLTRTAEAKNLKLICAFNRRYDPTFKAIAQQLHRGDVGKARVIRTCSRDSPTPTLEYVRTSGGFYHDCFVHDLDLILWYANELPIEVYAHGIAYDDQYKPLNDFDTSVIMMRFPSGLYSVTDLSRFSATGYEQRCEVFGPKGVLKVDEITKTTWEKHTEIGMTKPNQCYSFSSRYLEAYHNTLLELFNHIEGNKVTHKIMPGYLPALSKVAHAVHESAHGNKLVQLSWTDEEIKRSLV